MKKLSPVWENMKAAGRLITEWRDTLTVLGSAVAVWVNAHCGYPIVPVEYVPHVFSGAMLARESLRFGAWVFGKSHQYAGHVPEIKYSRLDCTSGAAAMANAAMLVFAVSVFPTNPGFLCGSFIMPFAIRAAINNIGGVKKTLSVCEYIWDWPRKNNGGHTQTERFWDGAKNVVRAAVCVIRPPKPACQPE